MNLFSKSHFLSLPEPSFHKFSTNDLLNYSYPFIPFKLPNPLSPPCHNTLLSCAACKTTIFPLFFTIPNILIQPFCYLPGIVSFSAALLRSSPTLNILILTQTSFGSLPGLNLTSTFPPISEEQYPHISLWYHDRPHTHLIIFNFQQIYLHHFIYYPYIPFHTGFNFFELFNTPVLFFLITTSPSS